MPTRKSFGVTAVAVILVVCGASRPAGAGVIRHDRADSLYLNLAAQSQYACVGRFDGQLTWPYGFWASGTLISPDWVLTAAHVVDQDITALSFKLGATPYSPDAWVINPGWNGDLRQGYDIALVHLASPATGVTPATRYTGTREQGKTATTVGYGLTGTGLTVPNTYDGKKRAGNNVIDQFWSNRLFLQDFDNPLTRRPNIMGAARPLDLEYLAAAGDSGGGVFISDSKGTHLVGVTSFLWDLHSNYNADYGDASGHTRVSAFNSWIDDVMSNFALTGNVDGLGYLGSVGSLTSVGDAGIVGGGTFDFPTTDLIAVQPLPEPASLSLLLLVVVPLLSRRHGRVLCTGEKA